ncbi:MAG: hypothetical protein RL681_663 [Candidatus Parcubacteria bacterium]|jgi:hypothetical protein
MDEQSTTGMEQGAISDAVRPRRFWFVRRFAVEVIVIGIGVTAGVAFANWRGVSQPFSDASSLLAQTTAVVGEAIQNAVAPDSGSGKTVAIDIRPAATEQKPPITLPSANIHIVATSSAPKAADTKVSATPSQSVQHDTPDSDAAKTEPTTSAAPANTAPTSTSLTDAGTAVAVPNSAPTYRLTIQLSGAGSGIVQSSDLKIVCGSDCVEDYPKNASLIIKAYAESGSSFAGWSMPCAGTGSCGIALTGDVTIAAFFNSIPVPVVGTEDDHANDPGIGGTGKVLFSEIMAGSGETAPGANDQNPDNEFIELYNPTDNAIALTGWMIKKKSSSGAESVLVSSARFSGKVIPAHGYFLIVHEGLYQGVTPADMSWPSSYDIAYSNNGLVLYDGTGGIVETVTWATIPVGQSYARTTWSAPTFVTGTPTPKNSSFSSL